jgi:chromosome segregation ATPase
LQREIEAYNNEYLEYQTMMKRYFNESKERYDSLTKKEEDLSKAMAFNEREIARLTQELSQATKKYTHMKETLEGRLVKLEADTAMMTSENKRYADEIVTLTPGYEELCKLFEERSSDYEEVRKKLLCKCRFVFIFIPLLCSHVLSSVHCISIFSVVKTKKTALETNITKTEEKTQQHEIVRV